MSDFPWIPGVLFASSAEGAAILFAMLVVFATSKLLEEIFERLKQPGIVGAILAGTLIGPSGANWIQPSEFLSALSELGAMFLLFRVGLEIRLSDLLRVGVPATIAAVLGVVVPLSMGFVIMRAWGASISEALFVGTALVATSVGITARVLSAKGWLQLQASRLILAAAAIDDVLGLLVLAVVTGVAQGSANLWQLAVTAAISVGFVVFVATLGTRTMRSVVPRLEQSARLTDAQFNLAMVVLFALGLLAMRAGVAAIIGAFLAGVAMAETASHRLHDLTHGVTELLLPFFLAGIGLKMDVSVFSSGQTVALAAVILVAAIVSKVAGCGLGALPLGKTDAWRVGIGMVPRGEVGMVVAQLGLSSGLVTQQDYAVVVFMSIATTMIAPPLLNWAYREAKVETTPEEQPV